MRRVGSLGLLAVGFTAVVLVGSAINYQIESRQYQKAAETAEKNRQQAASNPLCREGYVAVRLLVEPRGSGYDRVCIPGYRP